MSDSLALDTTHGSPLHKWLGGGDARVSASKIYLWALLATYVPLLVAALVSPLPLLEQRPPVRLPFLHDWNIAFMFSVTFPSLVVLIATDDGALGAAVRRVQKDGVMLVAPHAAAWLTQTWEPRFRFVNVAGYGLGAIAGLLVMVFNYIAYAPETVGYWITFQSKLTIAGVVFLYCVFLFYSLIPLYVLRTIAISLFLRDVVAHSSLAMLPFHPDRCGGLRPVGQLGLRSQFGLTVFGLNVVSLTAISFTYLDVPSSLYGLIVAAAIAYLVVGPIVFMGPLLPFRAGMLRAKADLLGEVAQRLRIELQRLRAQLPSGSITREDEELIDRLRKVGSVIDQLPVWPFDAGTLRTFVTAYLAPVAGVVGYPLVQWLIERLATALRP